MNEVGRAALIPAIAGLPPLGSWVRSNTLPKLDIIIVNWNAGTLLRDCIESIRESHCDSLALSRVVVVDNASTDESIAALPDDFAALEVIRNRHNRGFAAACNQGAAGSHADYLLFLNPDIRLDPETLAGAVGFMENDAHQAIEISGIRLRGEDGETQRCCARFPTPGRILGQALGLDRLLPGVIMPHFMTEWDHRDSRAVPQVMGAFLLIRAAAFRRVRGFDERFFLYYEDVDLCRRVADAGGLCFHNAEVSAVHVGGGTTKAILARRQYLAAASRILYARKYFGAGAALVILAALLAEPMARSGRALLRGRAQELTDTLTAMRHLWRAMPDLLRDGEASATGEAAELPAVPPKILALTRYSRLGASSRTRFIAYLDSLRLAGAAVTISPFFDENYLTDLYNSRPRKLWQIGRFYLRRLRILRHCRDYDVVWIEKEALPWIPLPLELLLLRRARLVVDFDDAWFLRYRDHPLRPLLGTKLEGLARRAEIVVAGNPYLVRWAQAAGAQDVAQLPTAVPLDRYQLPPARAGADKLRIGWIGTPSSAELYLRPLAPVLAQAAQEGWAEIIIVGAVDPHLAANQAARFLPWGEEREVADLQLFDVGIMPLEDDRWSQGKCAYKLLQYMAVGLPVVASPVGMNCDVVTPGVNGFLARTQAEWLDALRRLAEDPALRQKMGAAGRRLVEQHYSLELLKPRLATILQRAAQARR